MAAAIRLRSDYTADDLRRLAKASRDAKQTRRLLALAVIYDGGSRADAARVGGVGLQIVRDWVLRFNSVGPVGLIDRKAPGKAALLTTEHRSARAQAVEDGPVPWRDGVVRWRLVDLAAWLREEFGATASRQTLGRELRRMTSRSNWANESTTLSVSRQGFVHVAFVIDAYSAAGGLLKAAWRASRAAAG